jgi:hypothetical protein
VTKAIVAGRAFSFPDSATVGWRRAWRQRLIKLWRPAEAKRPPPEDAQSQLSGSEQ